MLLSYFIKRKILPGYKVKRDALVIDIGSGDKPFWRANVFMDKLSLGDLHRHTDTPIVRSLGKFINADVTKTKFKNKAFDFSFCAHLLEHVEKPNLAIKEIMRISKSGYIEVPNGVIEFISPFHSHLWFILQSKNKLIFVRKSTKLHKGLLDNSKNFSEVIGKIEEPFIRLYWNKKIEFEIIDNLKNDEKYFPPPSTPKTKKNYFLLRVGNTANMVLVLILRKISRVNENINIEKLLK